jgi:TolB-like protein/DNA-binding winged helix-turn-helix (wHTH) protein/Tfp pilus assembly protein PilF
MEETERRPSSVRFGAFQLDPNSGELLREGVRIKLQEQPFQALVMLLERPGEVLTREELQKKLWPANTFVDFDRGLNKAINRLREALGDDADQPRFIETLPQRGYRFIASVELPAIVTADSVISESTAARAAKLQRRRWVLLSAVSVALALSLVRFGVSGWRTRLFPSTPDQQITSLAVLPLENLSNDPAQEYFSVGMTDELITAIASVGSLRVISRTSSMQYKGSHKSLPTIAHELGVDAIIEGTILRAGDRVRITTQLIRARDDQHLWAGKYDRSLRDVLQLQAEVAQAIAGQVQSKLIQHTNTTNTRPVAPEAYEAYLEGIYFMGQGTERLDKSIERFSKAIRVDPGYARAYAGLSESYTYLAIYGLRPPREVYPKARDTANKALELDETVSEAHQSLADVKKFYDWDWAGAEEEYRRAIVLNPSNSLAHAQYADYLSRMGRYGEAIASATRAQELDPLHSARLAFLGLIFYRARNYDAALIACKKAIELDPYFPNSYWFLALTLEQKGQYAEAIHQLQKAVTISKAPIYQALLAHAHAVAGDRDTASTILSQIQRMSPQRYVSPVDIALIYTGLGDRDSAFVWLEKAYQERAARIGELAQPNYDNLRADPRFTELMSRLGLRALQ